MNEIQQDTLESYLDWTVQAELGGERSNCLVTVQPKTQYINPCGDGLCMDMKCDCVFSCASACVSLQQHSQYCQWFKTEYLVTNRDNNVALRTSEDCSEMWVQQLCPKNLSIH